MIDEKSDDKTREESKRLAREDVEADKRAKEILSVVRMFDEGGAKTVARFLALVEKARGAESAERLRRAAWDKIQARKRS